MAQLTKKVKEYVGSGVILGIGSSILGQMGQGQIAGQVITPSANMMGPLITADLGMSIVNQFTKHKRYKGI